MIKTKDCGTRNSVKFFEKRWIMQIILELYNEEKREKGFNELKRKLHPITPKILSEKLDELEKEGLISKNINISTKFPRSEYYLTESGMDFVNMIIPVFEQWVLKWNFTDKS